MCKYIRITTKRLPSLKNRCLFQFNTLKCELYSIKYIAYYEIKSYPFIKKIIIITTKIIYYNANIKNF